ncbi:Erythroid differentiation-related factor 1 [Rhynchospora pubera]|uniref:Erythroid differentiation-related factor 1 n=1 Tax=Rhynchospora pubera TaxID=906938 RepID=A0AAV8H7W1_9POAL|nr:Erythroid differentiation-related factor 1 [Rhynchospora pubera]
MEGSGKLQCVGRLEVTEPKPVGFLCGTIPVPTNPAFPLSDSALLPSPSHTIGAPRYQMLPVQTDLNTLPVLSNLPEMLIPSSSKNSEGFYCKSSPVSQNLSRKCESLAVSGIAEYGDEIDVIAPTDILKQIFKIPYSKAKLSIAVHRIGDTLILNTGPDVEEGEKIYRRPTNQPQPPPQSHHQTKTSSDPSIFLNFAMHSVRMEACDCPPGHEPTGAEQTESPTPTSTILPGTTFNQRDGGLFWSKGKERGQGSKHPVKHTSQVGEKARGQVQESEKIKRVTNNDFTRVLMWQFHNFRMLLGSDLLIVSNERYVAVSLHLWDVSRQVTPLKWLDAWLDNLMASVPELAICYHRNGVVQGYELLKTDDIFLLKGVSEDGVPAFLPQVVQQNGLAVLRFLQDNCKQDPGAYWLYKGAGEDVIQLFDLSTMPTNRSSEDHSTCPSLPSLINKGRRETLFSLGTLLYRVAHRLSLSKARENSVKCARFFKKCLDFLSEQDHLVIRAYAHEEFARLILRCYEELELNSESLLLESGATVIDLEEEGNSEFTIEMLEDSSLLQNSSNNADAVSVTSVGEIEVPMENLELCPIGNASHTVPETVSDPISSKLAAIHHISQAIKSLSWKRQLRTDDDFNEFGENFVKSRMREKSGFSICSCGDPDCLEICDIREWLPKFKVDMKMWKLVLLLGESYLALGEAYKENGQLHRALKVVEVASLVYGSMPDSLEDSEFISSMSDNGSGSETNSTKLFWTKAWMLVGDLYAEYYRLRANEVRVKREKIYVSNEVVEEVKRLKKKLGKDRQNCGTCSLINCSCQSDRASSGSSASSSTSTDAGTKFSKRRNKKPLSENTRSSAYVTCDTTEVQKHGVMELESERREDSTKVKNGGIFKFLEGPRFGEVEFNLNSAVQCYEEALKATAGILLDEVQSVKKKKGWACNELGRYMLEKGDLIGAEREFSHAIKTFQEASDHKNVILINCNLGHGRRALAEDFVSKMGEFKNLNALKNVYLHTIKRAKSEYLLSLEYYTAAKRELTHLTGGSENEQLSSEALTQYAHTYLRLGMLLAKESVSSDSLEIKRENNKEISASDAFREALSTYESLSGSRKQEAAFCHYQLGCYHRDICLKFVELEARDRKGNKSENKSRQRVKWYGSLAEKNYYKAADFYGPNSHPSMYIKILMELSSLSCSLSSLFHSSLNLEAALMHLLEARHVVEEKDDNSSDLTIDIKSNFWSQLQSLLKTMLSASMSGPAKAIQAGSGSTPSSPASNRVLDSTKLKEMYRMSLKSNSWGQLHAMYRHWVY